MKDLLFTPFTARKYTMLFWLTLLQTLPLDLAIAQQVIPKAESHTELAGSILIAQRTQPAQVAPAQSRGATFFSVIGIGVVSTLLVFGVVGYTLWRKFAGNFGSSVEVLMQEFFIDVSLTDKSRVRTNDNRWADVQATVYICIADKVGYKNNAKVFLTQERITNAAQKRVESTIRAVAGEKTIKEIYSDRKAFTDRVQALLDGSLKKIGLTCKDVALLAIEENGVESLVDVDLIGQSAVRTQDEKWVDIRATFYVYIAEKGTPTLDRMIDSVKKRAEAAIRAAASENKLDEIKKFKRPDFDKRVKELLGLENVGSTYNNIIIYEIEESDISHTEYSIDINLTDESAVRTCDFLRADIEVTLHVKLGEAWRGEFTLNSIWRNSIEKTSSRGGGNSEGNIKKITKSSKLHRS